MVTPRTNKHLKVTAISGSSGVALVEFARPPVNAFNQTMWEELGSTFNTLSTDGKVRVVVLASALPKIWTAGLDLTDVDPVTSAAPDAARKSMPLREHILLFQEAISAIEKCSKPVIAAVHGLAIGLAVDILCACDIRYAEEATKFSIKEIDVGMAADIGTLARLPKIVGNESAVRELTLTGREFSAAEAKELGFVSKVVTGGKDSVVDAAVKLASVIASKSPVAVVGTKHLLLHARDHSVQQNLEYTALWNSLMLQSSDAVDSFNSFRTKKQPIFKDLNSKL